MTNYFQISGVGSCQLRTYRVVEGVVGEGKLTVGVFYVQIYISNIFGNLVLDFFVLFSRKLLLKV